MKLTENLQIALYQARELWRHNPTSAYVYYEDLLLRYPNHPSVLREYGKAVFMEHNDLEKALNLLERALADASEALLSWLYLGLLYGDGYGKGYPEAINIYQQIIQHFPKQTQACVEAYLRIGMSYRSPGVQMTLQEAIEAFRHAIQLDPYCPAAYQCFAEGLYRAGDQVGAREALDYAIRLRKQKNLPVNHLLSALRDLAQQKPWKKSVFGLPPSLAYHWPDEVME